MIVLAFVLAIAGFVAFGLSTHAQYRQWFGDSIDPPLRRLLRIGAWLSVAGAFIASVAARGWVFGPVVWFGAIMFGAGLVFLLLNFAPQPSRRTEPRR